jgi:hypothetical protein
MDVVIYSESRTILPTSKSEGSGGHWYATVRALKFSAPNEKRQMRVLIIQKRSRSNLPPAEVYGL